MNLWQTYAADTDPNMSIHLHFENTNTRYLKKKYGIDDVQEDLQTHYIAMTNTCNLSQHMTKLQYGMHAKWRLRSVFAICMRKALVLSYALSA